MVGSRYELNPQLARKVVEACNDEECEFRQVICAKTTEEAMRYARALAANSGSALTSKSEHDITVLSSSGRIVYNEKQVEEMRQVILSGETVAPKLPLDISTSSLSMPFMKVTAVGPGCVRGLLLQSSKRIGGDFYL